MDPMQPTEFERDGVRYRIKVLNVIEQWHLNRKLAPLLPPLLPVLLKIARDQAVLTDQLNSAGVEQPSLQTLDAVDLEGLSTLAGPFAEAIAQMSNEVSEEIFNTCFGAIQRFIPPNVWTGVWAAGAKVSQFPEFNSLHTALPFVVEVIRVSLGPFIQGFLTSGAVKPETTA